eukprot:11933717-Alexandrium_andersonii.AAC.1
MSASLVGSEMCIRDSVPEDEEIAEPAPPPPQPTPSPPGDAGEARDLPVSYTHLTLPTICSV